MVGAHALRSSPLNPPVKANSTSSGKKHQTAGKSSRKRWQQSVHLQEFCFSWLYFCQSYPNPCKITTVRRSIPVHAFFSTLPSMPPFFFLFFSILPQLSHRTTLLSSSLFNTPTTFVTCTNIILLFVKQQRWR